MSSPLSLKQYTLDPNAGDVASGFIVANLTARPVRILGEAPADTVHLIAVGSILHWADENSIVWGTGLINNQVVLPRRPRAILAVRGPLTRQRLQQQGIDSPAVFGDPGVFLPDLFPKKNTRHSLGIVPHYVDRKHPFIQRAAAAGAKIIDVTAPLPEFSAALSSCEKILSSSLHGIVFAHAYGIPSAWIKLSDAVHGNGFKFFDYYASIGITGKNVQTLTPEEKLEVLAERCHLPLVAIDGGALRNTLLEALGKWFAV